MSTFFTTPASQRKRKRADTNSAPSAKRRIPSTKSNANPQKAKTPRPRRDESISSSGSEDERLRKKAGDDELVSESDSEDADETNAERRLRLASQYLQNIKGEVGEEVGFDAEDIDRDLIAERLEKDVAETKGRLHKHIASNFDYSRATHTQFRYPTLTTTSIATCGPYAYTVSKDLQLIKWQLPDPTPPPSADATSTPKPLRRRPTKLLSTRGNAKHHSDPTYQHHTAPILCVAASTTNKYIATGGLDKKLIIWSATDLQPLRVFTQHRDAVTSLAFRKGTNQLYSASKDRTIKTWSLDEMAYVETLFGHQDEVVDVAALAMERCVSVGARDRTARLWKVVEETQLVFRGGGAGSEKKKGRKDDDGASSSSKPKSYHEGSIDRVAMVDEETFVTGSDNGSLSLWSLQKKKPVFTVPLAHGLDPALKPEEISADVVPDVKVPERNPRWITALATVPLSDLVISGSWDGCVRVWRVSEDTRRLERVGVVGRSGTDEAGEAAGFEDGRAEEELEQKSIAGIVNDLSVFERGERGNEGLSIIAAIGTEPRLGRWKTVKGKNGAVVFEIPKSIVAADISKSDDVQLEVENGT